MAENLRHKTFWGGYNFPWNDQKFVADYGLLYKSWIARRATPKGWHLPSVEEWEILLRGLGFIEDRDYHKNYGGTHRFAANAFSLEKRSQAEELLFKPFPDGLNIKRVVPAEDDKHMQSGFYWATSKRWWTGADWIKLNYRQVMFDHDLFYQEKNADPSILRAHFFAGMGTGCAIRCIRD